MNFVKHNYVNYMGCEVRGTMDDRVVNLVAWKRGVI